MFYYKAESYQQAADMIVAGKIPVNKSGGVSLPSQFRNLAWKTEVLQKETNSDAVFILFVTGHDQIYMYISTGIIEKGSGFDRRYRHQKKLKDKWFKVSH
jgi:hypothetical protein